MLARTETTQGATAVRRAPAVLAIVGLMFVASGCASLEQQCAEPVVVEIPAMWSVADASPAINNTSLAQWWLRFDDPLLARLVAQAMQANTSVKSAQAALLQARALRDVSAAALWPSLGVSASAQHSTSRDDNGRNSASNSFRAGLDASWELDVFGVNRSALNASEAMVKASAASLGDVQISIAAEVALDYIAMRAGQVRLAIAGENLASQTETLQITQWRRQAGLVTALEVEQARAQTEQTRAQLPALQSVI
ncbi:MAG: TolC family protein, partial [Betaproteobacteria bacterium]